LSRYPSGPATGFKKSTVCCTISPDVKLQLSIRYSCKKSDYSLPCDEAGRLIEDEFNTLPLIPSSTTRRGEGKGESVYFFNELLSI
jgi:hypothetical protein